MHKKLMTFLNYQKILYKKQFRFQTKKKSSAQAIISLIDSIESAMDNNLFVCGIFIDLEKAFDTANHNILLHELYHYGISDLVSSWFSLYLYNRKQYVTINGLNSET